MSKYRNQKTIVDGITFDSKREAGRYGELKLLERAGAIKNLELQPRIKLEVGDKKIKYASGRQVCYVADFRYIEDGKYVVEDSKGYRTATYKLKWAILNAMGIRVVEV